jgi:hypothetical protein
LDVSPHHLLATSLAVGVTLILLALYRIAHEASTWAGAIIGRSLLGRYLLRRPFFACIGATIIGACMAASGAPNPGGLWSLARLGGVMACALVVLTASPAVFAKITDPSIAPAGRIRSALRKAYADLGRHEVDGAWLEVLVVATCLVTPPLMAVLMIQGLRPESIMLFAATLWTLRGPIVDFEHGDSHYNFLRARPGAPTLGRRCMGALDWYSKYPLALMTGRIPLWYSVQHVAVHHAENNGLEDTQSTAPYDRASFAGFALCAQRFAFSGLFPIDVVLYLVRKRRMKPLGQLCLGWGVYSLWLTVLAAFDPGLVLLWITARYAGLIADAASFFQEHGLVDPDQPDQIVTNSLHYQAVDNDHGNRGDNFHIEHHFRPGLHWTRYRAEMIKRLGVYEALHAVGYCDGPGQLRAYYRFLWRDDFAALAEHFRLFGSADTTTDEAVQLLRKRTAPAGPRPRGAVPVWLTLPAERLAARLI